MKDNAAGTAPPPEGWRVKHGNRGANGGTTTLPSGMQWRPGTQGYRERLRRHKQAWAEYEALCKTDGYARASRERLLDYVAELNVPEAHGEIVAMSIALKAKTAAVGLGFTWTAALNRALNELEAAVSEQVDPAKGVVIKQPVA